MRRIIAERLTVSSQAPTFYETVECRADSMMQVIKHLNAKGAGTFKISVNDFIIKAVARASMIVRECNTHWHDAFLRRYDAVDVSVAVATPSGLITPIVRDAHVKGLAEIAKETKILAEKARAGNLQPHEYQGGTIGVSNLGGMGVNHFTAILNPPHSTILAVGSIQPRMAIAKNEETGEWQGTGKVETIITFTATFDHRAVDGAVGAEWFKHFKDTVENPLSLLL